MLHDFRYAIRTLRHHPGFALVAILSLALGIGANAAIFSLTDAMLLRPLPLPQASRLVWLESQTGGQSLDAMSYPDFSDFRKRTRSFQGLTAHLVLPLNLTVNPEGLPQVEYGMAVTGNFFDVLGVSPQLGRTFRADEDQAPGRDAVAVVSDDLWRAEFGSDPQAVGRQVRIGGIPFTIIGITPKSFSGLDQYFRPALYVPAQMLPRLLSVPANQLLQQRDTRAFHVMGRLAPGVSRPAAAAEARVIARQLEQAYPEADRNNGISVMTDFEYRVNQSTVNALILGIALLLSNIVLVIACANVANLLLSRARGRKREIAVRLSIGAGRGRLIRQLLTESLVIALVGGAVSLLFAQIGVDAFAQIGQIPGDIPIHFDVRLDYRVLGFALLAAFASVLVFGLVPSIQASKADLVPSLKTGIGDGSRRRRFFGRNALMVAQVAGSLVLLIFAAQLYGWVSMILSDPRFRTGHMMMASFDTTLAGSTPAQTQRFYDQLVARARALPGVSAAALTRWRPLDNQTEPAQVVPEGFQLPPGKETITAFTNTVGEGYFETLGIAIVRGRGFQKTDTADSPRVAIINERFAQKYYPHQDPIGKRFRLHGANGPALEIVGVARWITYSFILEPPLDYFYLPLAQGPKSTMTLLVTTKAPSSALAAPLRNLVRSIDPGQPILGLRTMEEYYDNRSVKVAHLMTHTVGAMALLGLVLALTGLYGLMSYSVSQRSREIGIRMAVGADRVSVMAMVLKQGLTLAGTGTAAGLLLSIAGSRSLTAATEAPAFDFIRMILAAVGLIAVAALGAYLPARRAALVDPLTVLRVE